MSIREIVGRPIREAIENEGVDRFKSHSGARGMGSS